MKMEFEYFKLALTYFLAKPVELEPETYCE